MNPRQKKPKKKKKKKKKIKGIESKNIEQNLQISRHQFLREKQTRVYVVAYKLYHSKKAFPLILIKDQNFYFAHTKYTSLQ